MESMKWFYSFFKKYRFKMALGLLMVSGIVACNIISPKITGIIVDDVITDGRTGIFPKLLIIFIALTLVKGLFRYYSQVVFEICSQSILFSMRDTVYRKLMKEDFSFYNRNRTGDLMSRQTGDMDAIRHFVAYVIYTVFENMLMFILALIMIFTIDARIALIMLPVLPLTALNTYFQAKAVKPTFMKIRNSFSSLNTLVQENISGNRVVKAFSKEDYEMEKFKLENDKYRKVQLDSADMWKKYIPRYDILSYALNIILLVMGSILVIKNRISVGDLVTVNGYLWMVMSPLCMAGWWINDIYRFTTSVEKVYSTYVVSPDVANAEEAVQLEGDIEVIEFRNVSYDADGEKILKDISFTVHKGQRIGIIGSTGSGKTTVMNLLCRFYDPTEGEILVNNIDIRKLDLYQLRQKIGMAMQDVFLFSDTIEGNIAYAEPDMPFEEVKKAAKMADANMFIKKLADGYDTIVGERGVGLSGGQKQRISLARALLKKSSILVLDDTTSAVDMETENYINDQLDKINSDCVTFVIAYRISSIIKSDLILVMDGGRIVERGKHDELVNNNGYYSKVFRHQLGEQ